MYLWLVGNILSPRIPRVFSAQLPSIWSAPVYSSTWSYSSLGTGLETSPWWTSWGSCLSIFPACTGFIGMVAKPSGVSATTSCTPLSVLMSSDFYKSWGQRWGKKSFQGLIWKAKTALSTPLSVNPLKLQEKSWWWWKLRWFYHFLLLGQAFRFPFQTDAQFSLLHPVS